MPSNIRNAAFAFFLLVSAAVGVSASPADSNLLALVPEGAQIVAGIEDPHNPASNGRLLLVTRSNNLDFLDWVALTGVDPRRHTDEVIEVATSSGEGELYEHLVLVAGQFNRERIFRAAVGNGAFITDYRGQGLLVVEPFAREKQEIDTSRWMAILDDRTAIFGTPELVRQALDRHLDNSNPDPLLVNRLRQFHTDVNSWNVLAMPAPMIARHLSPGQLAGTWTQLLDGADELTIGIHYGSTDRIDFAVHTVNSGNASYLAELLAGPHILPVDLSTNMRTKLQSLSVEQNRVRGSFRVPGEQFDRWLASIYSRRSLASTIQPPR